VLDACGQLGSAPPFSFALANVKVPPANTTIHMGMVEVALPVAATSEDWLTAYGWYLLLLFMLFVLSLYIWSYLSKNLERLKSKDTEYTDADVVTYLSRMVKATLVIVLLYVAGFVLAQVWPDFKNLVWDPYYFYILDLIFICSVLLVAGLIVKVLRRISRKARVTSKDTKGLQGSAVEFTSLLLSYIVYVIAAIIIFIVLLSFVPNLNPAQAMQDFLAANGTKLGATIVFIIAVVAVVKLAQAIFEDYKFRTKKFNPQVIDLFEDITKYVLYLIAFLVVIYMVFSIIGLENVGIILIFMTLIFLSLAMALSYSSVKNIISGLALMNTDTFAVGDKIKIGKDLVCEVVEKNLMFTKVRTEEGETVDVPNSEVINDRILNYDRSMAHGISVKFELPASVPHGDVERMVEWAVGQVEGLMKEPKPEVFARDFRGDHIIYEVHTYVLDAMKAKRSRSDLISKIQESLHADRRNMFIERSP
jgi:small conductance mechanosensitive channel